MTAQSLAVAATQSPPVRQLVAPSLERLCQRKRRIRLLDAGCGSKRHFDLTSEVECWGIDISQPELDRNSYIQHKILGDIQTHVLPRERFDAVVCWDVLEHLAKPKLALANLFTGVASDGLLILGFPKLTSFKGLVTKFTPLWVHAMFHRFMGSGFRPFKTYLRLDILPARVLRFATVHGFEPEVYQCFEGTWQKRFRTRVWPVGALFYLINWLVRLITFGHGPNLFEDYCILVLRKGKAEGCNSTRYTGTGTILGREVNNSD
jgi:hypothetical protein